MTKLPHWPIHTGQSSLDSISTMKRILNLMGNPHTQLKNVIHVSGTNGKGSTIAFLSQIIRDSGKSVNVYTSPHIFDFYERFTINGAFASNEQIFNALEEVRAVCEANNIYPTVIEASTVACFYLFYHNTADFNIIECCMGGLRDCTNVFEKANLVCTVITSISYDHIKYLGNTIGEIAFQKAGVQKAGVPSIIAKQKEEDANLLLFNYSQKFNIPAYFFGGDYTLSHIEKPNSATIAKLQDKGCDEISLLYQDQSREVLLPRPSLRGSHQLENFATALQVAFLLKIDMQNVCRSAINTKWVGRLQRVHNKHLPKNYELWFDGAHNVDGARALINWIDETKTNKKDYIVIGKSKGADQTSFISQFKDIDVTIIFVTIKGEIFPETSFNLHNIATNCDVPSIDGKTLSEALHLLPPNDIRVICCGSLYLLKDINDL